MGDWLELYHKGDPAEALSVSQPDAQHHEAVAILTQSLLIPLLWPNWPSSFVADQL